MLLAGRSVPIYSGAIYFDDLDPPGEARGLEPILDVCRQDALSGHRHFKLKIGHPAGPPHWS